MKLVIELKSDLCAAVGKGFAATIDTDTAVDEYGLPYIPARRIKGCLKDVARLYMAEDNYRFRSIFGEAGQGKGGALSISDAKLAGYNDLVRQCIEGNLAPNEVTNLFCAVRGETSIDAESASAKKDSLRYIRVVERLSPFDNQTPLVFEADISCPGFETAEPPEEESTLEVLVRRLRNIGFHRNRGLGWVKCSLKKSDCGGIKLNTDIIKDNYQKYALIYTVKLLGDLMLPGDDANHSTDYIPGSVVLGALAGKFVRQTKVSDGEFNELFYSGNVSFSNLYPSDSEGKTAYPAPAFLGVIKGAAKDEEKIVRNLITDDKQSEKTGSSVPCSWNNNQPESKDASVQYKPFKKDYLVESVEKGITKVKAKTKVVYHNALRGGSAVGLYTQSCLSSGQYYSGRILAGGEKMMRIAELLKDGFLRFGRSKTAQYSVCEVISAQIEELPAEDVALRAGTKAAFVLRSDAVIVDDGGIFTTDLQELVSQINKAYDQNVLTADRTNGNLLKETTLKARVVSGYNSKWNLKKPQFPAIKASSCIVFDVVEDLTLSKYIFIGEKQNEGFGVVELLPNADKIHETYVAESKKPEEPSTSGVLAVMIKTEKKKDDIIKAAIEGAGKIRLKASQVGRISLMCKESTELKEFEERVDSIKSDSAHNNAVDAFGKNTLIQTLKKASVSENDCDFWEMCKLYILTACNVRKYTLRKEGKTD